MMKTQKLGVSLLVLVLVGAACGDDDEGATTTTNGVSETTTTTGGASSIEPYDGSEAAVHECIVSEDLLWSPSEVQATEVIEQLLPDAVILESFDGRPGLIDLVPGDPATVLASFGRYIDLTATGLTAPQVLGFVSHANQQLGANTVYPVYAAAFSVHWGLEPGDDYQTMADTDQVLDFGGSEAGQGEFVGIVDSGFPGLGDWPDLAGTALSSADESDTAESHGVFVVSIIKQLAPAALTIGAKAGQSGSYVQDGAVVTSENLTDELAVVSALQRIRDKLNADDNSTSPKINLSLGTYACPNPTGTSIPPPGAIGAYLEPWTDATIFAAAGNENLDDGNGSQIDTAFYPAAYSYVTGVAAVDRNGDVVVWDEGALITGTNEGWDPSSRWWIDDIRIGVRIFGVAQAEPGVWSGSSFATAVATGMSAAGSTPTDPRCPTGLHSLNADGDLQACP